MIPALPVSGRVRQAWARPPWRWHMSVMSLHRCHGCRLATGRSTLSREALRRSPWWRTCWRTTRTAAPSPRCCTSTALKPSDWKVNSHNCSRPSVTHKPRPLISKKKEQRYNPNTFGAQWPDHTEYSFSAVWHKSPFISCCGIFDDIHAVEQGACLLSFSLWGILCAELNARQQNLGF